MQPLRACAAEDVPAALRGRRFLALCVPASTKSVPALDAETGEEEFRWVREFLFQAKQDAKGAKAYAITLREDGAFYVPITTNYALGKRKRKDFESIPVPEKVRFSACYYACCTM